MPVIVSCPHASEVFFMMIGCLAGEKRGANLGKLLKNKDVQDCARKCVATCIRGGGGTLMHTDVCMHDTKSSASFRSCKRASHAQQPHGTRDMR